MHELPSTHILHNFYSEASEKYIKTINRLNIVTFLISFLSAADQCPTRVVVAAGTSLNKIKR